jgi:2Fe-2S ferredoxin
MVKITYISHDGQECVVDVEPGLSVMEGARKNGVPGIDADCGGCCACGTCHVYVEENWRDRLSAKKEDEEAMLDYAERAAPSSRLSCQIKVTEDMEGLIVRTPKSQH